MEVAENTYYYYYESTILFSITKQHPETFFVLKIFILQRHITFINVGTLIVHYNETELLVRDHFILSDARV